jgi:hypothetical protein
MENYLANHLVMSWYQTHHPTLTEPAWRDLEARIRRELEMVQATERERCAVLAASLTADNDPQDVAAAIRAPAAPAQR